MSAPLAPDLFLLDQLDEEHQHLAFERLHFLSFLKKLEPLKPCRCGLPAPILTYGPPNDPGAKRRVECGGCGQYIAWLPKLKNKDRRSSNSTGLAHGEVCQLCQKGGVNLEAHHVIEVADGGGNDSVNLWTLCGPCHTVIHALRQIAQAVP